MVEIRPIDRKDEPKQKFGGAVDRFNRSVKETQPHADAVKTETTENKPAEEKPANATFLLNDARQKVAQIIHRSEQTARDMVNKAQGESEQKASRIIQDAERRAEELIRKTAAEAEAKAAIVIAEAQKQAAGVISTAQATVQELTATQEITKNAEAEAEKNDHRGQAKSGRDNRGVPEKSAGIGFQDKTVKRRGRNR